jgi:hypothetical protein
VRQALFELTLERLGQQRVVAEQAAATHLASSSAFARRSSSSAAVMGGYKYPPDAQEKATETVLRQAEVLADQWAS